MEPLTLFLDVPLTSFRDPRSRELRRTYEVPPPSTIFGFLLSFIGSELEEGCDKYSDTELAIMPVGDTVINTRLRQIVILKRDTKDKNTGEVKKRGAERRPEFVQTITGTKVILWVKGAIVDSIREEFENPNRSTRHGPLYFGESFGLVREFVIMDEPFDGEFLLTPNNKGDMVLPLLVSPDQSERVRIFNTRWVRCSFTEEKRLPSENDYFKMRRS